MLPFLFSVPRTRDTFRLFLMDFIASLAGGDGPLVPRAASVVYRVCLNRRARLPRGIIERDFVSGKITSDRQAGELGRGEM